MTFESTQPVDLTQCFYHSTSKELKQGDLIEPGNWGEVILKSQGTHASYRRETVVEDIRRFYFPQKPSRLTSAYVCLMLEDALFFKEITKRETDFIYKVKVSNPNCKQHVGCWNCLPPNEPGGRGYDKARPELVAMWYWSGIQIRVEGILNNCGELLVDSSLEIVGCVDGN
tara:strand:+ start:11390 stop:11902 length:513 start_codon:yes stop_codon:yes gene_type:complete